MIHDLVCGAHMGMTAEALLALLHLFETQGLDVWLDGGWGVDALLQEQTRPHKDADVVVRVSDLPRLTALLAARGFAVRPDGTHSNFVMADADGLEVDIHAVEFDAAGHGVYRMANGDDWIYPAEGFMGSGMVSGQPVRCLTATTQVLGHASGYVPAAKDIEDMERLRARFGVVLPPHLQRPA
jgi:lincosamide nucleotidyltransferase A/C/D/E